MTFDLFYDNICYAGGRAKACKLARGQGRLARITLKQKGSNMQLFNYLNNEVVCVCESKSNRSGFKHEVKVLYKGRLVYQDKIQYYNRTWESFQYESILRRAESFITNNIKSDHKFKKITGEY